MNKNKFRVWDYLERRFIYPDEGYQGHYSLSLNGAFHNLQNGAGGKECKVQQFIGMLDKNMKPVYEGDVVKCIYGLGKEVLGEIHYSDGWCAYFVDNYLVSEIHMDTFEVVGNMMENYIYNEKGDLEKFEGALRHG